MRDRTVLNGPAPRSFLIVSAYALLAFLAARPASAQEQPLLSEEIRRVFEEDGREAAEARYKEILEGEADAYEFDTQAMMVIGSEYAQAGNMEGVQAFYTIGSQMAVADFQTTGTGVQFNAMMDSVRQADTGQLVVGGQGDAAAVASAGGTMVGGPDTGAPRDDLARFFGLYRDPSPPGSADHDIMVSQTCDGRLAFAAMWGDVAPWVMRSEGDARFVQIWVNDFQTAPYELDFELGADARPTSVRHNLTAEYTFERWARAGDLPEGNTDCLSTLR